MKFCKPTSIATVFLFTCFPVTRNVRDWSLAELDSSIWAPVCFVISAHAFRASISPNRPPSCPRSLLSSNGMWKTLVTVLEPIRIFWVHLLLAPGELRPDVGPELGPDGLGGRAGNASSYLHKSNISIINWIQLWSWSFMMMFWVILNDLLKYQIKIRGCLL